MEDTKQIWEDRAASWVRQSDDPTNKYTRLLAFASELVAKHRRKGRALDIGCGSGLLCERLAEIGLDVYGTDLAEAMIVASRDRLAKTYKDTEDRLRVCQEGQLPFEGMKFDVITAIQVFPYIPQYGRYIRQLSSVLNPGGLVVASGTNRLSLWVMHEVVNRLFRFPPHLRTVRNLVRTGYHSGGHVDYGAAQQAYSARRFDSLFVAEGYDVVDSMDYYQIRRLDENPLRRGRIARAIARHLSWYHVGVYRKT